MLVSVLSDSATDCVIFVSHNYENEKKGKAETSFSTPT